MRCLSSNFEGLDIKSSYIYSYFFFAFRIKPSLVLFMVSNASNNSFSSSEDKGLKTVWLSWSTTVFVGSGSVWVDRAKVYLGFCITTGFIYLGLDFFNCASKASRWDLSYRHYKQSILMLACVYWETFSTALLFSTSWISTLIKLLISS